MSISGLPAPTHFAERDPTDGRDLQWRIAACLTHRIPDLQGIHITVFGNTAALRGEVGSIREKQRCLECCRRVPGVMRVVDDLTVAFKPEFAESVKLVGKLHPVAIEL